VRDVTGNENKILEKLVEAAKEIDADKALV
jgi:hypothetical protein